MMIKKGETMIKNFIYLVLLMLISYNEVFSQWQLLKGVGENQFIKNVEVENDEIVISISNNIYLTTDFGENWIHLNENIDKHFNLNINTFNLSFYKNNVFLISNSNEDPGIFSTDVNFINWKLNSKGLPLLAPTTLKLFSNESGVYVYSSSYQNLWIYNDQDKIWQIPYDTTGLKKFTIHSAFMDSNYYFFGTGYYPEAIPKTGCKTPNFFKIDKKTGKLYSILDTNSEICRYYILALNKKDNLLLAGTTGGFYISTNNGENWIKTASKLLYQDSIYQNDYIYQKILVKDNYIYALVTAYTQYGDFQDGYDATLIYSTDNGESWQYPNYNSLFPGSYGKILNVRDLEFYKDGLLIATSEGLYYLNKELTHIQKINTKNLSGETVFRLYNNYNKLFALVGWRTPTTGLWTSTDFGNTWKYEQNELTGRYMSSIDIKDNIVITGSNYSGYPWISKDFGNSFTEIKSNIFEQNNVVLTTKIIDDVIYIGTTKGVICSKDQGLTWFKLSNTLDKYFIFDILKINNQLLIATKNKILSSNDSGKTWAESNFQKDNNLSYYFYKLTACEKKIYAICSIYEQSGTYNTLKGGTIFATIDNGKTWFEVNRGLPNYDGVIINLYLVNLVLEYFMMLHLIQIIFSGDQLIMG